MIACGHDKAVVATTAPTPGETNEGTLAPSTTRPHQAEVSSTATTEQLTNSSTVGTVFGEMSALFAAIQLDASASEVALLEAISDPGSQRARDLAHRYFAGWSLETVLETLNQLAEHGLVGVPNPDVASVIVLLSEPILTSADGTNAEAQICRIDASIVVEPAAGAGGMPIIVNDQIVRAVSITKFRLHNGIWQLNGGHITDRSVGPGTCGV